MPTISKSQLKTHMLKVFREIEESGEELIVTDHARPVLIIQPIKKGVTIDEVFGIFQGKVTYLEDPDTPTTNEWTDEWSDEE